MHTVIDVAHNHLLRTVRRYGMDVALRRHHLLLAAAAALVAAAVAGGAIGHLLGSAADTAAGRSVAETLLWSVPAAVVVQVVLSSPARTLQVALDSPRSWSLLAQAGVSPATFVYGRYVLAEAYKALLVLVGYVGLVALLVLASGIERGRLVVAATAVLTFLAIGLARLLFVLRRAVRRAGGRRRASLARRLALAVLLGAAAAWLVVTSVRPEDGAAGAAGSAGAQRIASAVSASSGVALPAAVAAVGVLGVLLQRAHTSLTRAAWADVFEATARSVATRVAAPALPASPLWAITAVDVRRLLRSASMRLRPLANVGALVLLLAGGAAVWAALGGEITLPSDAPRPQIGAASVAMVGYGAVVASAGLLAMDADRHALTLWQMVPGGVRRVAAARAAQGAVIALLAAGVAVAAVGWLLGLSSGELALCIAAAATMAVFGPVIELVGSLRWPHVDWVEVGEVASSHPGKFALTFLPMLPVVGVLALLGDSIGQVGAAQLAVLAALLLAAVPVLAAALIRVMILVFGRSLHA